MDQLQRVTGQPQQWGRDMAYIGGVTALICTGLGMPFGVAPLYVLAATGAGAATGGALGAGMPALLDRLRKRVPLGVLVLGVGPLAGATWGGLVGAVAFALTAQQMSSFSIELSILVAAIAGAIQFGLSWFPYTFQTVRGARRWPVLLGATLAAPLVGVLTIISTIAMIA